MELRGSPRRLWQDGCKDPHPQGKGLGSEGTSGDKREWFLPDRARGSLASGGGECCWGPQGVRGPPAASEPPCWALARP